MGATAGDNLGDLDDDVLVRVTSERLVKSLDKPTNLVEEAVRDELARRRESARIQTFVPIFAERAARHRLAG
jgi:hypothetical protein